jgi:hypothetical protein
METKVLLGLLIAGVFASLGFVFKEWTTWASSTLVDLDKRTAVMETEIKHSNDMIAQNHEMLKTLMREIRKVSYNQKRSAEKGVTNIDWNQ